MPWKERRPNGWLVRDRAGGRGAGTLSEFYKTDPEASARLRQLRAAKATAREVMPGKPLTWPELLEAWAAKKAGHVAASTVAEVVERVGRLSADWKTTLRPSKAEVDDLRLRRPCDARYVLAVLRWGAAELGTPADPRAVGRYKGVTRPAKADTELMSDAEFRAIQKAADAVSPAIGALVHYLATYGARPITAAKLDVGDFAPPLLTMRHVKRRGPVRHALFAETVKRFARLAKGRPSDAPLFLAPDGNRWRQHHERGATDFPRWYMTVLGKLMPAGRQGCYELKRRAISRMFQGAAPWGGPLTVADIMLFTGHKTPSQVMRYARSSVARTQELVGTVGTGGKRRNLAPGRKRKKR